MGYAKYIGHVGALAVALGVGASVATMPGIAVADDSGTISSPNDSSSAGLPNSSGANETGASPANTPNDDSTKPSSASEGTDTGSGDDTDQDTPEDEQDEAEPTSEPTAEPSATATATPSPNPAAPTAERDASVSERKSRYSERPTSTSTNTVVRPRTVASDPVKPVRVSSPPDSTAAIGPVASAASSSTPTAAVVNVNSTATVVETSTAPVTEVATPTPARVLVGMLGWVGLSPFAGGSPTAPGSPVQLLELTWAALRRNTLGSESVTTARTAQTQDTSLTFATTTALVVANSDPQVQSVTVGTPSTTDGAVAVAVNATDPDGDSLSYAASIPGKGSVTMTSPGQFTYTPTYAARHNAAATNATTADKQDTFTITVSDGYGGQTTTTVTVSLASTPAPVVGPVGLVGVGSQPTGVVFSPDGSRAYVTNFGSNTVSVINTATNTVTTTITVGSAPYAAAITPNGGQLYVANATSNTVSVINTTTNTVTATIAVGTGPYAVAVTPNGGQVYVTNTYANTVSVINTTTNTVIATFSTGGRNPRGITASPDGTRLYIANAGSNTITVVNTATNTVTATIAVPTLPATVTLTPDGKRLYASSLGSWATPAGTVTVIDTTTNTTIATLPNNTWSWGAAVSPDGTYTYLTNRNTNTITKIANTSTANQNPTATVTVGPPAVSNGAVAVAVNAADTDGDPLTYAVSTPAGKGSITMTGPGQFTYTPTYAARHNAAATNATTADKQDTFTITVSDGYGGQTTTTVTVAITPANVAPNVTANPGTPNTTTGVVTGTITATDADGDALTYTGSTTTTKGSVTVNSNGAFTYTPTAAARHAASADNAAATGATSDTFTITITDGHGATVTVPVTVSISPTNIAPTIPNQTAGVRTPITGTGFYHVVGTDADGDALTYTVTTQALHGTILNSGSGVLTYTPNMSYYTGMTTASDTFVITVNDGHGGTVTQVLTYNWSPLTTPTNSINTSNTTVGFADSDLYFMSQADINRTLDTMQAMGVNNVRMIIPWAGVEGTQDVYTWGTIDYIVNAAYQRNMGVVAVLNTTPTWAATPGQPLYAGAPIAVGQYAEFAGLVAARYAGKISAYEIWNEPNAYFFWSPQPDPAAYTVLLQAAFPAIKAADPNATVIAGVLGSIPDFGNLYMNPVTYLDQMYDAGAHGSFDAISFHPYHYTLKFSEGLPWWNLSPINQLTMMHDLMVANGDGDKKIWSTEYGVPTSVASEATQAEFIADYLNAWSQFDFTGPSFFYTTRDTDTDSGWVDYTFGALRDDWTYKLAGYITAEWAATHPQMTSLEVIL